MRTYTVVSSAMVYWEATVEAENIVDAKGKIISGEEEIGNIMDSKDFEIVSTFLSSIDVLDTNNRYCSNCGTKLTKEHLEIICLDCRFTINEWRKSKFE